jgi:F0F1-type ATP synthase membrane subunit c/vacuolar-type H+-ATPase subunit K
MSHTLRSRALRQGCAATAAVLCVGLAGAAHAQQDTLRQRYVLTPPVPLEGGGVLTAAAAQAARSAPALTVASPTAFGAAWGQAFVGAGFQARTRRAPSGRDGMDGTAVAGFGIGDPFRLVGLEVAVTALGTVESFGRFGASFRVHRRLPGAAALAAGWENAIEGRGADGGSSLYAVASNGWTLAPSPRDPFSSVVVNLGVGSGRFLPEDRFRAGEDGVNVFASVSVRVAEPVSVVADWTGQDLALAASLAPLARVPLVVSAGLADVTGSAGDGARFILGVGFGFEIPGLGNASLWR